jgi:hypothetical protein
VEIWDGDWKFTGAAEPTEDRLNEGWFTDRAATAVLGDPKRAIFATTWDWSPIAFPMVWAETDGTVRGIDVTARYRKPLDLPKGHGRARVRVRDAGVRHERVLEVLSEGGDVVATAASRDERFDANDHVDVRPSPRSRLHVEGDRRSAGAPGALRLRARRAVGRRGGASGCSHDSVAVDRASHRRRVDATRRFGTPSGPSRNI